MSKYLSIILFLFIYTISINKVLNLDNDEIIKRIRKIIDNKNSPLIGGGLAVIKITKLYFVNQWVYHV